MAELTLSGSSHSLDLGKGFLDRNGWTVAGSNAILKIINRIKTRHQNILDAPAKAYSQHGPIYVPVTGKRRTKASLGGRQIITRSDIKRSREMHFQGGQAAEMINSFPGGQQFRAATQLGSVTPSGKSMKFANYAEYKKFLGKSGARDLELSGRMLNDIDILAIGDNSVTIGFKDQKQADKMAGNISIDDEWGFSPSDAKEILDFVESEGLRRIQAEWSGRAA